MKRICANLVALIIVFLPHHAYADPPDDVRFEGTIKAKEIVDKTCVVKKKKNGRLAPNEDINALSSRNAGGELGEVEVSTGHIEVHLTTSNELLYYNGGDEKMNGVMLASGIGPKTTPLDNLIPPSNDGDGDESQMNGPPMTPSDTARHTMNQYLEIMAVIKSPYIENEAGESISLLDDEVANLRARVANRDKVSQEVNSVYLYKVWFAAMREKDDLFQVGEYRGVTTVTCEPVG